MGDEARFDRVKRKRERYLKRDPLTGQFHCPVCAQGFDASNTVTFHYIDQHALADPAKMTVETYGCEACGEHWRVEKRRRLHVCPVQPRAKGTPRPNVLAHCSQCGAAMTVQNLPRHEATCRGAGDANRKCNRCGKILGSVQARKNHEARCQF